MDSERVREIRMDARNFRCPFGPIAPTGQYKVAGGETNFTGTQFAGTP